MKLLRDIDLLEWVKGQVAGQTVTPLVSGPRFDNISGLTDPYTKDSPVQPASLDLHVGEIFIPGAPNGESGSATSPTEKYALGPGHTAIVTTEEKLSFPSNIAGIALPPSRIAAQGLLMANPGHVDPGFVGPLHFTLINVGKGPYVLSKGDVICTLLSVSLDGDVKKNWLARRNSLLPTSNRPNAAQINTLSGDFLNLEQRAKEVAEVEVQKAGLAVQIFTARWTQRGALIAAVLAVLVGAFGFYSNFSSTTKDLHNEIELLKKQIDEKDLEIRLKRVEDRLAQPPSGKSKHPGSRNGRSQ
jgi:deoxycytidine triphosphate deaminase